MSGCLQRVIFGRRTMESRTMVLSTCILFDFLTMCIHLIFRPIQTKIKVNKREYKQVKIQWKKMIKIWLCVNYRFRDSIGLEKKKPPSSSSPSALYLFTGGKSRLTGNITCLWSHKELIPTIILLQQHSPRAVVKAGRQSREEGLKPNLPIVLQGSHTLYQ